MGKRRVSLAEAQLIFGKTLTLEGDRFRYMCGNLAISVPVVFMTDRYRQLILPRAVATSETDPELAQLLQVYPEVDGVEVIAGHLFGSEFALTEPQDCCDLYLRFTLKKGIVESSQGLESNFAKAHKARWYDCDAWLNDFECRDPMLEFWVIPTPDELRPILNRHADIFAEEMCIADRTWENYDLNKEFYRRGIETQLMCSEQAEHWGWLPGSDDGTLFHFDENGDPQSRRIYYNQDGLDGVKSLLKAARRV